MNILQGKVIRGLLTLVAISFVGTGFGALDPDVQQQLGPEWALIADGADLVLRGPDRGMMLMIR